MFLLYFWNQVIAQPYWEQRISRLPAHHANKNQPKAKSPYANPQKKSKRFYQPNKGWVLRHPYEWFFEMVLRNGSSKLGSDCVIAPAIKQLSYAA